MADRSIHSLMVRLSWLMGAFVLALMLSACSGDGEEEGTVTTPTPAGKVATADSADIKDIYRLDIGDKIRLKVYSHDDLTTEQQIDLEGVIDVPLIGSVDARGRTLEQVRAEVEERLNKDYIVNPKVTADLLTYRDFYVLGEVKAPGSFTYRPGMRVREAIALAGGFSRRAQTDEMSLVRMLDGASHEIEATEDTPVMPGDVIHVLRRIF